MKKNNSKLTDEAIQGGTSLVFWVGLATGITGIGGILIGRLLGPEDYGIYSLAIVLPMLLFIFSVLGIDTAIIGYLPKMRSEGNDSEAVALAKSALLLRTIAAAVLSFFGFIISGFFAETVLQRPDMTFFVQFSCITVFFEALIWSGFYVLQGFDRTSLAGSIRTFQAVMKVTVSIGLIWAGFGVWGAIDGFVFAYAISGVAAMIAVQREIKTVTAGQSGARISVEWMQHILRYGLPLYGGKLIVTMTARLRLVVPAVYVSDVTIGNFNAALNIAALLSSISFPLATALLPIFSKISSEVITIPLGEAFCTAQKYVAMLLVPGAVAMILISDLLVPVLYGTEYLEAPLYLSAFCFTFLLVGLGDGVIQSLYDGIRENYTVLALGIIHFTVFIVLALWLTPLHGIIGVIVSEITARGIVSVIGVMRGRMKFSLRIDIGGMLRIYMSSFAAGLFIYLLLPFLPNIVWLRLGAAVVAFIGMYMLLLPLIGGIKISDLDRIDRALRSMHRIYPFLKPFIKIERAIISAAR